jgi:glutathione synthase
VGRLAQQPVRTRRRRPHDRRPVDGLLEAHAGFPGATRERTLTDMEAVWVLNYPQPSAETEAWQLLRRLSQRTPFANDVTAIMMLGNKTNLSVIVPPEHLPRTLVSSSSDEP